ncbi:MAG: zinc ribbon domain-containing protein [Actinomycetota bacterium]|nr:zinc ribbon domain-containing protein [Actinomycetota bacterium]
MKIFRDKLSYIALAIALAVTIGGIGYALYINSESDRYLTGLSTPPATQPSTVKTSGQGSVPPPEEAMQNNASMPPCVCHSKNPSMVKMHDSVKGQSCDLCHTGDDNLMDPNRKAGNQANLAKRIKEEKVCTRCHLKDGRIVVSKTENNKVKISGTLFCPKCGKQITKDNKTCGTCGGTVTVSESGWQCSKCGPLVDVDKIAALSKEKPSNDICKLCHYDNKKLILDHSKVSGYNKSEAKIPGGSNDCLSCHKSHNQCGGCHF